MRYSNKFNVLQAFWNISAPQFFSFGNTENGGLVYLQSADYQYSYYSQISTVSTGKELDPETGYSYFGARYLDHTPLTLWLSVDPMSDKYPSISPYAYCAWNPLKLVDPDGDSIILEGDERLVSYVIDDMQRRTSNLRFERNENGVVSCTGEAFSDEEKYMESIINHSQIRVEVLLQYDQTINDMMTIEEGGTDSFLGNVVATDNNGNRKVITQQVVNVVAMRNIDWNSANLIWHAISESYEGGIIAFERGVLVSYQHNKQDFDYCYNIAHNNANYYFCGNIIGFGTDNQHILYILER